MEGDVGPKCPHTLVWSQSTVTKKWALKIDRSVLMHLPFCCSEQKVKRCELVGDPEFVKQVSTKLLLSGKHAKKMAVGKNGRMDGSLSVRTARRALNEVNRLIDQDYEDDWCKLRGWAREFEDMNPGSRAVIMPDESNRLVITCMCDGPTT